MRLAILADIHGNRPALEAVLADLQPHAVDGLIVAGDCTGGTHPVEVVAILRALGSWMIRGNGEGYFIDYDAGATPEGWRTSEQWATMRWSYERLDRETLDFITKLPDQRAVALDELPPIRVVHGSPRSTKEHLFADRDPVSLRAFRAAGILKPGQKPPALAHTLDQLDEPVLVCGHSHIPWKQKQDEKLALNPGSVGGPINGDWRAQYALLTWSNERWQVTHHAVAYDLAQVRADYEESGLLAAGGVLAKAFLLGTETGTNVSGRFLDHAYSLATQAGWEGGDVVPESLWAQAIDTFDWEREHGH